MFGSSSPSRSISGVSSHVADGGSARIPIECVQPSLSWSSSLSRSIRSPEHHVIFHQKLKYYGIDGKTLHLCESYLTNRTQYVEINGVKSGALPITTGVPQGSILGPLLFIIYINDFSLASQVFTFISYTDDTTLFSTASNFTNTPNIDPNCLINENSSKSMNG